MSQASRKSKSGARYTSARQKAVSKDSPQRGGAKRHRTQLGDRWHSYRTHHRRVGLDSLQRLVRKPFASLMTTLVLAVAMALPTGLYIALNNIDALSHGWDGAARLSMFLNAGVDDRRAEALRQDIARRDDVAAAEYISPAAALAEFREKSGFADVLDELDSNPLPGLIVITPTPAYASPDRIELLRVALASLPEVDQLKLDMAWLQKLQRITELSRRFTWALAGMLALGVLLIVGNTIKLAIESRRDEILVVKLVGGTNAFVRRPFLYTGLWYGVGGGLVAWALLQACLVWLARPVAELSTLYGSQFVLIGLGFVDSVALLIAAALLGLAGATLVVGRELAAIEPR